MSEFIVPGRTEPDEEGSLVKVTPESAGWKYVGFEVLALGSGQTVERETGGTEVCLLVLSGTCNVTSEGDEWRGVGGRGSVFDGAPDAVYLPPNKSYRIEATSDVEIALNAAPAERGVEPRLIRSKDISVSTRGSGIMEREIRPILTEDDPAERLLIFEIVTPNGHWSSYPPHKHDRDDPPNERYLEETYYHRIRPANGFALQWVYSEDRSLDEAVSFRDGDVVLVPEGYHTVSAPPGYDLYYLNVMAGPTREWKVHNDPDHEWLLS